MPREVHKAVCYVVHDEHILVFTHRGVPMTVTGVQVPAGAVEVGESPERGTVAIGASVGRRDRRRRRRLGRPEPGLEPGLLPRRQGSICGTCCVQRTESAHHPRRLTSEPTHQSP